MGSLDYKWKKFELWKLRKIFLGIFIPDSFRRMQGADVLLIGADTTKTEITRGGLLFSRLLDSLSLELGELGMTVVHLNRSPSFLLPGQTYSRALTYNRSHSLVLVISLLLPKSLGFKIRTWGARRVIVMSGAQIIFTLEGQAEMRSAAKQLGIPCVEVLHGIGLPPTGSIRWLVGSDDVWPSHVICFDPISASTIKQHSPGDSPQILLARNFWLHGFLSGSSQRPNKQTDLEKIFPPVDSAHHCKHRVLITLSWGHDPFAPDSPMNRIWNVVSDQSTKAYWRIRFHPVQLSSNRKVDRETIRVTKLRFSELKNVDIERCHQLPLPLIAKDSTHHITISSTSAYEMAEFGVPTLFLTEETDSTDQKNSPNQFDDLVDEGFAVRVPGSELDLATWLENQKMLPPRGKSQLGDTVETVIRRITRGPMTRTTGSH